MYFLGETEGAAAAQAGLTPAPEASPGRAAFPLVTCASPLRLLFPMDFTGLMETYSVLSDTVTTYDISTL